MRTKQKRCASVFADAVTERVKDVTNKCSFFHTLDLFATALESPIVLDCK